MQEIDYTQLRYLIVDDEAFVLNLTVRILNKLGCSDVTMSNNGSVAIKKLLTSEVPFDVIICDLNMPEMDGVEFMRHAAERNFTGGVIFLSGEDERMLDTAYELARAHKLNILGVMTKPLKPDLLQKMLAGFSPEKSVASVAWQEPITELELRKGLDGDALRLVYQPKVDVRNGTIVGVEALARWNHDTRGMLGPATFIPLAEQSGLINKLTDNIYRIAVGQTAEWLAQGITLRTAINFSINTFSRPGFTDMISRTAEIDGVDPANLVLEVTETQIMQDMVNCIEIMMRMRLKRFCLSIDDFGTGQSSMVQLKNIPFTELKIDRAFVHNAATNSTSAAILESSIDLARKLKMDTVAEGVETREDWDLVEKLGCDYVQGYYCAKPMLNDDLLTFLQRWTGPH